MFHLDGIWHAMDNLKDVNTINKKNENINWSQRVDSQKLSDMICQ